MTKSLPVLERLMRHVMPEPNSGCWIWMGALTKNGYAQFRVSARIKLGHRISYELQNGPVPSGLDLDHLCRIRCCVNPDHLQPVTRSINCRRGETGSYMKNKSAKQTHCKRGHPLTIEATRPWITRAGTHTRRCMLCDKIHSKRLSEKRRASRAVVRG